MLHALSSPSGRAAGTAGRRQQGAKHVAEAQHGHGSNARAGARLPYLSALRSSERACPAQDSLACLAMTPYKKGLQSVKNHSFATADKPSWAPCGGPLQCLPVLLVARCVRMWSTRAEHSSLAVCWRLAARIRCRGCALLDHQRRILAPQAVSSNETPRGWPSAQGCASELDIELATTFPDPVYPSWALPASVPDGAPPDQWPSSEQQPVAPLVPQVPSPSTLQAQCLRSCLHTDFAGAPRYTCLHKI